MPPLHNCFIADCFVCMSSINYVLTSVGIFISSYSSSLSSPYMLHCWVQAFCLLYFPCGPSVDWKLRTHHYIALQMYAGFFVMFSVTELLMAYFKVYFAYKFCNIRGVSRAHIEARTLCLRDVVFEYFSRFRTECFF